MSYTFEWEQLDSYTRRARVYDGWLVHVFTMVLVGSREVRASEALAFVPDAEHKWVIK